MTTLHRDTAALDGPEFLDAIADIEAGLGHLINAAEFRRRAQHWREDRQALEALLLGPAKRTAPAGAAAANLAH